MGMMAIVWNMWKEIFTDLVLVGKILFFPCFALFSVAMIPMALVEFLIVDVIVMLLLALSKTSSPKDLIEFLF